MLNENTWFQEDSAPRYFTLPVRDFLNVKWIGRQATIESPPDLRPLDFFLLVYLKSKVDSDRPQNLQDMKNRITLEFCNITQGMIHNAQEKCRRRFSNHRVGGW